VETRKDAMAYFSPLYGDVVGIAESTAVDNVIATRNAINSVSSYAVMDSGYKYQYDAYNDKYRWVPLNADMAGLAAYTDNVADPWYSPAGFTRGQVKNVIQLALNPSKTSRDKLYKSSINPVVSFVGEGVLLYGDRTQQAKPSAFQKINIRRLFIVLEKSIAVAAKYQLFEFNDSFTRAQFVNMVEPFLREVKGRRGVLDYSVVCDETNNTPEVIDRSEFVADIYIKPAYSINFIQLNFVAVRSGVEFSEIIG
jgi:phage tail sheath protein FI